ncbi:MAG TPA: carbon-nitrogen hydrolase family protein [Eubacteriales bacterium]|nr:carbon-nitrogen hydrolase family protein [Eubacteriales bacterium]
MKIGAYQFPVSYDAADNIRHMQKGVRLAADEGVRVLSFAECSVNGYPQGNVKARHLIEEIGSCALYGEFGRLAREHGMFLLFGGMHAADGGLQNAAFLAKPDGSVSPIYAKRALWGWDRDNFLAGNAAQSGVFEADGFRLGVRICFEVRFPEFFRELYAAHADAVFVLFNDRTTEDSIARYELIEAHLRTRAVENVFPIVSVNNCDRFQGAPTAAFDENGTVVSELPRHQAGLLTYSLEKHALSFGAEGRKTISDNLLM